MRPYPLTVACVCAILVHECGEPLVDIRAGAPLLVDPRRADPSGAFAHLRSGVVDRLVTAQSLLPREIRLLVIEGYRLPAVQERRFREYHARMRRAHPGWSPEALYEWTVRRVPPPELCAHVTGAAVDLTLCTGDGVELPMGCRVGESPRASRGRCFTDSTAIPATAREYRTLLGTALHAARLVNCPTRWWHWSHGDRYWAVLTDAPTARYGPVPGL
jgi:D-alanyl-D-alanine dipeptidase